eukprot:TRINITY_DN9254_c0_g1_i1.p1 TRINITY_DN9254_c0_g1~~TRINITY_DN9254_c0_g1_i1.p1  ORF type:complete len:359 (+),score=73.26 TRINITY_DN9254_c0_g1_i1:71-1147(+)
MRRKSHNAVTNAIVRKHGCTDAACAAAVAVAAFVPIMKGLRASRKTAAASPIRKKKKIRLRHLFVVANTDSSSQPSDTIRSSLSSNRAQCSSTRSSFTSRSSLLSPVYVTLWSTTLSNVVVALAAAVFSHTASRRRNNILNIEPYMEDGVVSGLVVEVHLPMVTVLSAAALHVTPHAVKIPKQFEVALPFPVERTPVCFGFDKNTHVLHINLKAEVPRDEEQKEIRSIGSAVSVDGWINLMENAPPVRKRDSTVKASGYGEGGSQKSDDEDDDVVLSLLGCSQYSDSEHTDSPCSSGSRVSSKPPSCRSLGLRRNKRSFSSRGSHDVGSPRARPHLPHVKGAIRGDKETNQGRIISRT